MRHLKITAAKDRYDRGITVKQLSWKKLAARLQKFEVTPETFAEYQDAGNDKLAIKDVGWFIGGPMDPPERRKANLQYRDVLCLDADHLDPWELDVVSTAFKDLGLEFVCHSSHSHSDEAPRLRYVLPFDRPVRPDEYEPIARKVANWAGIDYFDDTTYQVSRVMFLPSRSVDGDEYVEHCSGEWIHVDAVLDSYEDWRDWASWPVSSREQAISRDPSAKAEDPYSKPGAIGAFNRLYEVPYAIEKFDLPYVPSGMGEDRYSYAQGSSVDGAIYYPDDGHLYSWHESDPARGNRNAWDLVRLHHFGELDAGMADDTPVAKLESQKKMLAFATGIPDVARELAADYGFEDLGEEDTEPRSKPNRLDYDGIRSRIESLPEEIANAQRKELTRDIAASNLTPAEISGLCGLIKARHEKPQPSKQDIVNEVKGTRHMMMAQTEGGDPVDIELDLIERVLDDWFEGGRHLKRFARQFWSYEHGVWVRREDEFIRGLMQRSFIALRRERPREAMALVAAIGEMDTSAATSKLWQMFCAQIAGNDKTLDPMHLMERSERPIINVLNGHIEFNKRGGIRLVKHDPSLFFTSQVPLEYDPEADTSHWDSFCDLLFHESLEPDVMQRHLEEVGGYIIQPWRDLATIFLMRGEPAAGKSTFGELLIRMLGQSAVSQSLHKYRGSNNHDTAGLVGKLVLLDEDYDAADLMPAGFLKSISEERQMTANPKGKDEYNFVCRAVPMILTNDWPQTKDHSGALQRRLIAWDMATIPLARQDLEARRALLDGPGLQGALRRFVEGFARLYKRGGWEIPDECADAGKTWELHADMVRLWIHQCFVKDPDSSVRKSEMHGWFVHWYGDNVQYGRALGRNKFLERVKHVLGEPGADEKGVSVYRGLRYSGSEFEAE